MWEALQSDGLQAGRDLIIAGLVCIVYRTARDATEKAGRIPVMLKAGALVLLIAAFAAFTLGQPPCESRDPMFGACIQQAGDGYAVSSAARAGSFLFWIILLGVPVMLGAMKARVDPRNPWAKPDRTRL